MNSTKRFMITFDNDKRFVVNDVESADMAIVEFAEIVAEQKYMLCIGHDNKPVLYKPKGETLFINSVQEIVEKAE